MNTIRTYRVVPRDPIHALEVVRGMNLQGAFYPNSKTEFFILEMTDDQAIILKLKTPCRAVADE